MKRKMTLSLAMILAAGFLMSSVATAAPSSGLLLGVYAYPNFKGLRVTDTMPGYSAQGRLFSGDVLLRVADGSGIYSAKTPGALEYAKDQIGPFSPAALEVHRPNVGTIYLWVEFQPVGGGVQAYSSNGQAAPQQFKAKILTEKEKPGAAAMFRSAEQKLNVRPENKFEDRFENNNPEFEFHRPTRPHVPHIPKLPKLPNLKGPGSLFQNR